jgi:hypothetical protein
VTNTDSIKKTERTLAKLERNLSLEKIKQRKKDTRRKIELGGLVIKAEMDLYSKDVILGALIQAKKEIEEGEKNKRLFEMIGKAEFLKK